MSNIFIIVYKAISSCELSLIYFCNQKFNNPGSFVRKKAINHITSGNIVVSRVFQFEGRVQSTKSEASL